jgi:hypothetical protein
MKEFSVSSSDLEQGVSEIGKKINDMAMEDAKKIAKFINFSGINLEGSGTKAHEKAGKGTYQILENSPQVKYLLGDGVYSANWRREILMGRGTMGDAFLGGGKNKPLQRATENFNRFTGETFHK